jgi:Protein of unknown function (DUF1573)
MKKIRAIILLLLVSSMIEAAERGPKIVCDAPVYTFGQVPQTAVVTNVFVIRNAGDTTFIAGMPRATCGCTTTKISKRMIGPGETADITAVFTAARRSGDQRKMIYVVAADEEIPVLTLYMEGFIAPPDGPK